jgi:hypothetical protein
MINELSRNPLFFLRYSPPESSGLSHAPTPTQSSIAVVHACSSAFIFRGNLSLPSSMPSEFLAVDFASVILASADSALRHLSSVDASIGSGPREQTSLTARGERWRWTALNNARRTCPAALW